MKYHKRNAQTHTNINNHNLSSNKYELINNETNDNNSSRKSKSTKLLIKGIIFNGKNINNHFSNNNNTLTINNNNNISMLSQATNLSITATTTIITKWTITELTTTARDIVHELMIITAITWATTVTTITVPLQHKVSHVRATNINNIIIITITKATTIRSTILKQKETRR